MPNKHSLESAVVAFILAYVTLLSAYLAVLLGSFLPLIPGLTVIMFRLVKKFRSIVPQGIIASGITLTSLATNMPALFIPIALATPFIVSREALFKEKNQAIFGPSTVRAIKYALVSFLLVFLKVDVAGSVAALILASLLLATISYVWLSNVKVDVLNVPKNAVLGKEAFLALAIRAPRKTYVVIEGGGSTVTYTIEGYSTIKYKLPTAHVGKRKLVVKLWAMDYWGLAFKHVGSYEISYSVIPLTAKVIEVLRKKVFSRAEIAKAISEVEVVLVRFGREVGAPFRTISARGTEVAKIIQKYLRRVRVYSHVQKFLEKLAEILGESVGEKHSTFKRGRFGEYLGVRYYIPGDPPKLIHWKKSINKQSLVVKELSSLGIEGEFYRTTLALEPAIIVDMYATNATDLDRIVFKLLTVLFSAVKRSPLAKLALVVIVGNAAVIMKGKAVDILYRLYRVFKDESFRTLFEYDSEQLSINEKDFLSLVETGGGRKLLNIIYKSNMFFTKKLIKSLIEAEIYSPKPFTLIHSASLTVRYTIVKAELSNLNYIYVAPDSVAEVAVAQVRR